MKTPVDQSPAVIAALDDLMVLDANIIATGQLVFHDRVLLPDLFVAAVLNRSLQLLHGFADLVRARNYLSSTPLFRLQLDNVIRLWAGTLVPSFDDFVTDVLHGRRIDQMPTTNGKQMTDNYLVKSPQEAMGHLCLLVTADDQNAKWSCGPIRISDAVLSPGRNRDTKRSLSADGREQISWLFQDADLSANVLLELPPSDVAELMALPDGTKRMNQLFRVGQGRRITGSVIETVGQQQDSKRRVRGGAARSRLQAEAIIIPGDYSADQEIARQLSLPVPQEGEFVSIRVAAASTAGTGVATIDGRLWRVAAATSPITPASTTPGQT